MLKNYTFPIKLFTSAGLLWYCFSLLEFSALKALEIYWIWAIAALLLFLLDQSIGALRFKRLLDPVANCSLITHIKYYFWSGFFNATLPSSIGGDAMRIKWLAKHNLSYKRATFFVILERLLGVITLLIIAIVAALSLDLPAVFEGILPAVGTIGAATTALSVLAVYLGRKTNYLNRVYTGVSESLKHITISTGTALFLLSLLYQIVTVCIVACVARSIGIPLAFFDWFFIAPLLWLLTTIPISIGGLGVRELGLVFFLGAYGHSNEQAVVLGLLTYLIHLVGGLIGGVWYVFFTPVSETRT